MSTPNPFLNMPTNPVVKLDPMGGMPASVHVIDSKSIDAINAALATRRPLLIRGEPGTGKSQLARAAAVLLKRNFWVHSVDARTETRDLLYTLDAVARLATAQLMSALHKADADVKELMDVSRFVQPGPIWWAFHGSSAQEQATKAQVEPPVGWNAQLSTVVLIDEIDKADASVPNGLLDALGHNRFDVPGRKPVELTATQLPLIVMTTNEERSMPDAFLRRCLVLHLGLPKERAALIETLVQRGKAHFASCHETVLGKAAEQLYQDREAIRARDLVPPGLAEYVDLLRALVEQKPNDTDGQLALLKRISQFMYEKHPPELTG